MLNKSLKETITELKVIPMITIYDVKVSTQVAKACLEGGLKAVEVTLRENITWDAIANIKKELPELILGIGTVRNIEDITKAQEIGADFISAPAASNSIMKFCKEQNIELIPGIQTFKESQEAKEYGYFLQKFFPAELIGGTNLLKEFIEPLKEVTYYAIGGINHNNAKNYLQLPNVSGVSGSWITPEEDQINNDWEQIYKKAKQARINATNIRPSYDI